MADESIQAGLENMSVEEKLKEPEEKSVLGENNANNIETSEEKSCDFCKKSDPTKRCSKRHPKCLTKMFCNETCELGAHKKKEDPTAAAKVAAKKAADKKKKAKAKKENNFGG